MIFRQLTIRRQDLARNGDGGYLTGRDRNQLDLATVDQRVPGSADIFRERQGIVAGRGGKTVVAILILPWAGQGVMLIINSMPDIYIPGIFQSGTAAIHRADDFDQSDLIAPVDLRHVRHF